MASAKSTKVLSPQSSIPTQSSELRFIKELGRRLLVTVHPKKVANRVAEALQSEFQAEVCGVFVELEKIGFVSSTVDNKGFERDEFLNRSKFKRWVSLLPPQVSSWIDDRNNLMLSGKHEVEYVSPLNINDKVCGAIIVGFSNKQQCREHTKGLIDATAQMAAMSISLSAHYEAAMDASINSAKEEHRKFTETVLDALPVSLYVIDREYRIATWNRHRESGQQGLSRDSVIGRNVFEVLTKQPKKQLLEEFERVFETGVIERIEQRTIDESGSIKHWLVNKIPMLDRYTGDITHVITIGEDVTMRVEAMQAVGRAEKLAAIGRLAAGVVHEINNPLATISACAEALETRVNEGGFNASPEIEDLREYLGLIRNEAFRCKSITNGLLDFSRVRAGYRMPLNMAEVVRSSANLIVHQNRGEKIEIKIETAENLPLVDADEGQMQQAIIALATNAIDAMPEGGTLTFRSFAEKGKVILTIEDTGSGIPSENISKIFEPFFTTKEVGKGTGLGLAVCYGIVTEHGGRLSVSSNKNGTIFTIALPSQK